MYARCPGYDFKLDPMGRFQFESSEVIRKVRVVTLLFVTLPGPL